MIRRGILFAAILSLGSVAPTIAQEGLPGSVFLPPAVDLDLPGGEVEVQSDIELFLKAGFTAPEFRSYGDTVDGAKRDLIFPDYEARTGKKADYGLVEIAAANLTGGNFNDMIVMSHLPGDCGHDGCLVQIWSMVSGKWFKRLEFTATGVAWKPGQNGTLTLAAVGDNTVPSYLFLWDGSTFSRL